MAQVPFDLAHWQKVATQTLPKGLPNPISSDPKQAVFNGQLCECLDPLQVAVARLTGFRWPFEGQQSVARTVDEDGIVCLPALRGEEAAVTRLQAVLAEGFGHFDESLEKVLLSSREVRAQNLETWLRDSFFTEHCGMFFHRPFIWHIWDGRKRDGFHALVNYHKLAEGDGKGRRLLESLTYSYLGDWIARQQDGVKRGEGGAEDRLAAALELQKRLVAILEGEPPFDLFVRWKPIEEQPIGWEPDINDGVRLNIRPFMAQDLPGGKKGAGILRASRTSIGKKTAAKSRSASRPNTPGSGKTASSPASE